MSDARADAQRTDVLMGAGNEENATENDACRRIPEPVCWRPLKAAAIVLALVLVAPGVDAVMRFAAEPEREAVAAEGLDAGALIGPGDPFTTLAALEAVADAGGGAGGGYTDGGEDGTAVPPAAFMEEIGLPVGARDVRTQGDGTLVGYVVDADRDVVADDLAALMKARGWTRVSLGEEGAATYVKSKGRCTWALATCTQVGDATSVVVRSVVS